MSDQTANQKLATQLLGRPVNEWIAEQRGRGASLFAVAIRLETATGGAVAVTPETIRLWSAEATV